MAIIAMVVTLALRGYSSMLKSALAVSDLNNLRQIGLGAHHYISDHNGILPPVMARADGGTKYAQEYIAEEMGITASLRDPLLPRETWGPLVSKFDKGSPPKISPLRSYGVNLYMGEVFPLAGNAYYDARIAKRYMEVSHPSSTLYFIPMQRNTTDVNAQARFSELTLPTDSPAGFIRTDASRNTPALWADGHVSSFNIPTSTAEFSRFVLPKTN